VDNILSEKEVFAIINAGKNLIEQCFIALLYESWGRISEVIRLKIKDIKDDEKGRFTYIQKTVTKLGRKGRQKEYEVRHVVINKSLIYLRNWLHIHPHKNEPESPIFGTVHTHNGKWVQISRATAYRIVVDVAKCARIKKRVFPHLLRHSVITIERNRG